MATEAGEHLRLAAPGERGVVVLRGTPGHLRGTVNVANTGPAPVMALPASTVTERAGATLRFSNPAGAIVAPGAERRVRLHANVDPTTAPGSYPVELDVGGQTVAATVEVIEQISLTLSPSTVVIDGVVGAAGSAAVLATNSGNIPLAVSQAGPVPLDLDATRATFIDRLFGRRTVVTAPTTVVDVHVHTNGEAGGDDHDEEDDRPRVTGTLAVPIVLAPGETQRLDWDFTIEGELEPGRRYRAVAPCYTADLEIVVVPHQDAPVPPPVAARAIPTPAKTTAKNATAKRAAKKSAPTKRAGKARTSNKTKAAARARRPSATEE
jgi:hypothetical protein